ncbi:peptidase M4 family protein [Pseudoalteromonas phenolica]|uniref:Peptidase M4 family protein n=1 Tax=Pseudoalteromonas phenolica TaxID=161398 RepID=A0A5S3YSL3_9GAMM|nr:M4 family metallopeptidase [Pseudoalteromonas phenolica]TMP80195.1 peptidase M4 family protein [Pseudoalteromonas phenolica]
MANWTKLGLISSAVFASFTAHSADSQRVTSLNQAEVKALISAQSTLSSNNTYFAPINNHGVKQLKATHQRMQQFVLNTPIWGQQLSIQTASQHVSGFYAANLDVNKLKQLQTHTVNENDFAQAILKKAKLDANTDYELHETKRYVYLENGEAVFAQLVQLEIKLPNEVLKPTALITEYNNKVVKYWNDIHHAEATGPGGNEKMGRVEFGDDLPAMQVTQDGDTCYLENEKVKTVSLESNDNNTEAFSFPCSRNTHKEINGAYSPLNEAHAYGTAVFDMYNDWYGTAPLTFQLLMRVHYGNSYENAFWNGSAMTFGDGASRFHPLTSLDIVSHEVSHGFTEQNSDLIYREQSGGINEAFSDIAGEAAEFFLRGANDWLIGADIMKTATALRYFETPSLDGVSIGHADDYYGGIDVHYSSGVFNRAFFLLANTEGWGVRKAFDVMVRANQQYWVASTDFVDGACGVINSAIDLGYEIPDVVSAFEQVGVECDNIQFIDADQDGMDDNWELLYGLNPADANDAELDLDSDTLSNLQEYQLGSFPNNTDSDNDGLQDGDEVNQYNTSPANADSDSDRMPDGWEVQYQLDPTSSADANLDNDEDGFSNVVEYFNDTDPTDAASFPEGTLELFYNFEDGLVPENFVHSDQSSPWFVTEIEGQKVLTNNDIGDSQRSSTKFEFVAQQGAISFDYKTDTEQGYDYLEVYLNGEQVLRTSGQQEWSSFNYSVLPGANEIEFVFDKDASVSTQADAVYIDNIYIGDNSLDTDQDGMPDFWEVQYGLDINDASDAAGDLDNDGLSNLAEYQNQTAPNNSDSDSDGMPDGWEVQYGLAPTDPSDAVLDADDDGFSNLDEYLLGTEPNNADSFPVTLDITTSFEENTLPEWLTTPDSSNADWIIDRDMTSDGQQSIRSGDISDDEISSFVVSGIFSEGKLLFDLYQDTQQWCCDYLQIFINDEEVYKSYGLPQRTWLYQHISIPEGLNTIEFRHRKGGSYSTEEDLVRLDNFVFLTNNSTRDSDNDGLPDLWELEYGLNWNDSADAQTDSDIDGLTALQEFQAQTSPINSDTDSDQLPDGFEVDNTLNPLDAADAALDNDVDSYTNLQEFYANSDVNSSASLPRQISQLSEDFEGDLLPEWFVQTVDSTAGWELSTEWHQSGSQSLKVNTDDYNDIAGFAIAGEFEAGLIVFESNGRNIQVYLNDQLVKDVNSYQETMSAISLSNGFNVVRFIGRRSSHIDDISLGIEIPADRDSDSDGIPDVWELEYGLNPRDSYDATHDVDYDGLTNIQEYNLNSNPATNDTDNDGVQDSEDSHPNDASQGENQAPVFVDLSEQKIEARSDRTRLRDIYIPEVTDNGHLEPNVYLVSSNYLELGPHQVTWRARDNVGNETEDHVQTINIVDTTAPEYRRGLSDAVVRTHEQLAALLTERNVFYDRVDQYDVTVSIDPSVSLHSGNRRIPVSVTDKSGNSETHTVDVGILPELIIPEAIVSAQEGELSLPLILDGESPFSSMSLDLEVDGNHVLGLYIDNGDLKLSPQIKVESSLFIEGANIKVKNVSGAYVAEHDTSVLSVKPAQYTPNLTASLMVDQLPTSVLESTQTYAELRFFVEDLNVGNEHEVEVSPALSSGYLDYSTWYRDGTYGFNPSELEFGTHNFTIKVTETNTESPLSSEIVLPITIVAPLELTDADTDNDGISDAEEGLTDRDRDGIVDYLDAISSPSIATLGDNQSLYVLDMSARVTLGQVKSGFTDGFATDMSITAEIVEQYSETAFGSTEQLFDPHYRDISKTASVTAVLLAGNTSATLTLPSQVTTLLNTTPKVRALTSNGWITLEEVQTDESCTHCVAFNVIDGGDMDLDGVVNGLVDVVTKLAVADANRLPELVFEAPESINENTSFELDASQSFDLDKDEISYTWSISNAAIELEPKDDGKVTLTVGELAESIDTVLTLVLNDGYGIVEREFNITFNHVNALPVITLTDFIQVNEQTAVAVSASATDKESTSLSYEWTQKTGMAVEIQDATSQTLAFTAPSVTVDHDLEFELAVNDGSDIAKSLIKVKVLNNQTDGSGSGSTDGGSTDGGSTDGGSTDSGSTNSTSISKSEGSGGGSMPVWLLLASLTAVFVRRRRQVTLH